MHLAIVAVFFAVALQPPPPAEGSRGNDSIESFRQAKKALASIYDDHRITIYSGCAYDGTKSIDYAHCNYRIRGGSERAYRIEWEHVVPASKFGTPFAEWRDGAPECLDRHGKAFKGRHCAAKVNHHFRRVEADMHNLYPEIGELNELRGDLPMANVDAGGFLVAALQVKATKAHFEPRPEVKGDIARTYLYMDRAYPELGILRATERRMFEAWSADDPVDAWECERARRIAAIQGNTNVFVQRACAAARL